MSLTFLIMIGSVDSLVRAAQWALHPYDGNIGQMHLGGWQVRSCFGALRRSC